MNSMYAFMMGALHRDNELMVFDWDKSARLIKESGCSDAYAGLQSDWGCTGGCIFSDGKPNMESYTFLASTWAVPELEINGEYIPCYKMQSETPGWDEKTKWPESALKILKEEE